MVNILEWTSKNGVVEMYNKTGEKWLGKYNPTTGKVISTTTKLGRVASFVGQGISRVPLLWLEFIFTPSLEFQLMPYGNYGQGQQIEL